MGMTSIQIAGFKAYAMHKNFQRRLAATRETIAEHKDYCISTSWGKDSVVLLHLAATIWPDIVIINARYPNPAERFEDMDYVRDIVLSRPDMAKVRYTEVNTPGEWEMYERAGGGFAEAITPEQREATRWWKTEFNQNMAATVDKLRCCGSMLGLRAEESHARRMNILVHGDDYTRKDGTNIALPLAEWTGKDIWAYLVTNNLPWLRIYDEATCGRERARSGFVFATGGAGAIRRHGVWEDWKRVYPDEFRAWMKNFPELDK